MFADTPPTNGLTLPMQPLPEGPTAVAAPPRSRGWFARMVREIGYLLVAFPIGIASFVLLVTGFSVAGGTLVIWVGVPLFLITLGVARGLAGIQRAALDVIDVHLQPPIRREREPGWRGWLLIVREPQSWLDVLHGLLVFPLSTVTFSITVTWVAGALGGVTYPIWEPFLPDRSPGSKTLADLIDSPLSDVWLNFLIGLAFLLTLVPVIRACAAVHSGFARMLLGNQRVRDLEARVQTLTESRAAVVEAEAQALRSLERDIHDGPQQRLVRLGMDLSVAERRMADDPEAARALLAEARAQTTEALDELRALTRGIAPPVLADRGLFAALAGVAARCPVPVDLQVLLDPGERLTAAVENAAYFVVSESLTNVAKHSRASIAHVRVERREGALQIGIEDDGVGGAHPGKGHGLAGLMGRVAALDGALTVTSPPGGPTRIEASIPCG